MGQARVVALDAGAKTFATGLLPDLIAALSGCAPGDLLRVSARDASLGTDLESWCRMTRNAIVAIATTPEATSWTVRCGAVAESFQPERLVGSRLWLYANFDCNLRCDYCCVRSSPRAPRRALGLARFRQIAAEAAQLDVSEIFVTGGEPFLLPDIADVVQACTRVLPTILLTNGMLFRGRRLDALRRMDTTRLTLQISLDSATPDRHDQHRGRGSWVKAVAGIHTAHEEGFRVGVAATLPAERTHELAGFHAFLDELGIEHADQIIRAIAHRGFATEGVELTKESLVPEVTITADGVYWHPVSAGHDDQLVTTELFPLADAIAEVRRQFSAIRAHAAGAAQWFPCA